MKQHQVVDVDPFFKELLARRAPALPADAVAVAASKTSRYKEVYSLRAVPDAKTYELWVTGELAGTEGEYFLLARSTGRGMTNRRAAKLLVYSLWKSRGWRNSSGVGFTARDGVLAESDLEWLETALARRLWNDARDDVQAEGSMWFSDGNRSYMYRGGILHGQPNGQGVGYGSGKSIWCKGGFRNGYPHGQVSMSTPGGRYVGNCAGGRPYGYGTEYHSNGNLWFEGEFGPVDPKAYTYGSRIYVCGRLYDRNGVLIHDGAFERVGPGYGNVPAGTAAAQEAALGRRRRKTEGKTEFGKVFNRMSSRRSVWFVEGTDACFDDEGFQTSYEPIEKACGELKIDLVEDGGGASPGGNIDIWHVRADFLDGGIRAVNVDSVYEDEYRGRRGVFVSGAKAVLLLALQMGLYVSTQWLAARGLRGATLHSLKGELK